MRAVYFAVVHRSRPRPRLRCRRRTRARPRAARAARRGGSGWRALAGLRRQSHDPGHPVGVPEVGGHRVHGAAAGEEPGVAHRRGEPPRLGQGGGVLRVDEAGRLGRREGAERRRRAQPLVVVGVLELDELDAPLDVAEAAVAELEVGLAVGAARQALGLHPGLEGADLADLTGVEAAVGPADRVDEPDERLTERRVTGHRCRAQQRLGLPDERPPLVVGAVGVERAGERAVLALGPQARVDLEPRVGSREGEAVSLTTMYVYSFDDVLLVQKIRLFCHAAIPVFGVVGGRHGS